MRRCGCAGAAPFSDLQSHVRHRGQEPLTDAARTGSERKLGESWAWERYLDVDQSPLEGAALALWGLTVYGRKGVIDGSLMGGED